MDTIFNWITQSIFNILLASLAGSFFLFLGIKTTNIISNFISNGIVKLFKGNKIAKDVVHWVENEMPDKIGPEKLKAATVYLRSKLPWVSEKVAIELIEYAVKEMNESLKRAKANL